MTFKVDAFARSLKVFVGDLKGPAASRFLADTHRQLDAAVLAEETQRSGVEPGERSAVDGRVTDDFDAVRPNGRIVTVYDYRREAATFALQLLRFMSPVRSGAYRDSHFLMVNGSAVDRLPPKLRPEDWITITNDRPYARKLEVGSSVDGTRFIVQVQPRIYQRAVQVLRDRYGGVLRIWESWIELAGGYVLKGQAVGASAKADKRSAIYRQYLSEATAARAAGRKPPEFSGRLRVGKSMQAGARMRYPGLEIHPL
jgi:hypothetical protein